jgi:hypothetical protein
MVSRENQHITSTMLSGMRNEKFGSIRTFDPNTDENGFAFNLNTRDQYVRIQQGDPNYPEPIELLFCPYCGMEYTRNLVH